MFVMEDDEEDINSLQNITGYTSFDMYQLESTRIHSLQTGEQVMTTFHRILNNWVGAVFWLP